MTTRAEVTKPPYSVPTLAEISELPPNGFTVASTFAGGGGSSTGYRMAGFTVAYANEFVPAARETYAANARPGTIIDDRDIRTITAADLLDRLDLAPGQLDVLDGSPPCASFSTAGRRNEKWGRVSTYSDTAQRTDDLFFEYARLLDGLRPKVFVAENVSGLVKGVAKGYFKQILARLQQAGPGYQVTARLLDAQWLGVPQARQRVIFIGVRSDLDLDPVHPAPLPYRYTLREIFPYVAGMGVFPGYADLAKDRRPENYIVSPDRVPQTVVATPPGPGVNGGMGWMVEHDTSGIFSQGDVTDRPSPAITVGSHSLNSWHYQVADPVVLQQTGYQAAPRRLDLDQAAPSVTTVGFSGTGPTRTVQQEHPDSLSSAHWEDGQAYDVETGEQISLTRTMTMQSRRRSSLRKFTLAELRAICSFPPDYVLTGTYAQRWERLGRSVPPVMMSHVARSVAGILDQCAD